MFFNFHPVLRNEVQSDMGSDAGDASFFADLASATPDATHVVGEVKPEPTLEAPKPEPQKAEVVKPDKGTESPNGLKDKLGAIEDPKEEEETGNEEPPPPDPKEGKADPDARKNAWSAIKAEAKQVPGLKKQLEELQKKYDEKVATAVPKDIEEELNGLRQQHAMFSLKNSKEYQQTVIEPGKQIESEVADIAKEFGLDEGKLWDAFGDRSEWRRNGAIDKILAQVETEIPNGLAAALYKAADKMHGVWQKQAELEQNAEQVQASYERTAGERTQQQTAEQEAAWNKASEESRALIEKTLGSVFKNLPDNERMNFTESLKSAKISDDPAERALQAQAPHVAAVLIQQLNKIRAELAASKKENAALTNARPGTKQPVGEQPAVAKSVDEQDEDFFSDLRKATPDRAF